MNFFKSAPLPVGAVRHGVAIVRKIFAEVDCSNGISTTEIYQRALAHPIPEGYKGDERFAPTNAQRGPVPPPHNHHPIRSRAFLKKNILPVLEGAKEVQKVVVDREVTAPVLMKSKKGKVLKATKPTLSASPLNPIMIKVWVWKPMEPPPPQAPEEVKGHFGAAVGVGEDISHLSKRRQGSREEKIQRDVKKMRELQKEKEL